MAGSRKPGPSTPSKQIAARTPGSLGINDQADRNRTTLMGDTPGTLGVCDWADQSLPQGSPFYDSSGLICVDNTGTALSIGNDTIVTSEAPKPPKQISLEKAQDIALKITTYFEGGKSMNYRALADDFDGQGTSFGLIQWNFGSGTLGPLLKKMQDKNTTVFASCFGADADYNTLKQALVDGKKADQLKWARDRIKNKRKAWEAAFKNIGLNTTFNKIQHAEAVKQYHPKAITVIKKIREISSTLFVNVELRSYVAIFDLCVQQGSIDVAVSSIKQRISDENPSTQLELMKIVFEERSRKAKTKWVSDCLSRRMGILNGVATETTENDITVKRKNPQLALITKSGEEHVKDI